MNISKFLNQNNSIGEMGQTMTPNVPIELQEKYFLPPFLPPNVLRMYLIEQEGESADEEDIGEETGVGEREDTGEEMPAMPGEQTLSPSDIGRMVELKKIYSRLMAMSDFLKGKSDKRLLPIRKSLDDAIYLFKVVVDNFSQYKDKIDEIIVNYYKFIREALRKIKTVFKSMDTEEQKERKKRERLLRQYTRKELTRGGVI